LGLESVHLRHSSLAPVALFVYKRPEHTQRTVGALRRNHLAQQSDLFVFADGAKNDASLKPVQAVRRFIRSIEGFKSVTIVERESNLGLSKSVITGVSQLCSEYGRVIAVEDDILTAPDFLTFLNSALERYAHEPKVFSVGGFNLPIVVPADYSFDAFCSYRFMCWGWGTWRDRWEVTDWSVKDYPQFVADRERQKRFNRGGNDCSWLLGRHMSGSVDSWDTVFAYTHSKYEAVALLPAVSKSLNIGFDGSGTHRSRTHFAQTALRSEADRDYRFPERVIPDPYFAEHISRLRHRSIPRRVARYFYDMIGLT